MGLFIRLDEFIHLIRLDEFLDLSHLPIEDLIRILSWDCVIIMTGPIVSYSYGVCSLVRIASKHDFDLKKRKNERIKRKTLG